MVASSTKVRVRKRLTRGSKRPSAIVKNTRVPLWSHQKITKRLCKRSEIVYDLSDPGTGKTRAHLESFAERRRKGGGKCLVLAPKSLLETAWTDDAWKFVKDMRCSVAYSHNRTAAFSVDADIYVTNIDAVKWLDKNLKPRYWKDFDTLIVDEIPYYKHRTSARSKAALRLSRHFTYRTGFTGTPNPKSVTELWHQMMLLDGGQRLGNDYWRFRSATQYPVQIGPRREHIQWHDKEGIEEAVFDLLSDITVRHEFEKCMDIPPNVERYVEYRLPPKLFLRYKELEEQTILELDEGDVVAVNAAVLRNKLLQLASGAVYTSENNYEVLDTARYELITDLVAEHQHSVVFYNWKHQRDELLKMAESRGIPYAYLDSTITRNARKAKQVVDEYQAGEYQVIYMHPATGAHGLTLTRGTRTIWASPIYQPDFLKQGKHRIYRGGQTKKTETIMIEAKGTVEKKVFDILNRDNAKMVNFLELAKEAMADYEEA